MNPNFDELIAGFLENRIGICHNFLSSELSDGLKKNLKSLYSREELSLAGIGNSEVFGVHKNIRNDKIFWLDRNSSLGFEEEFFKLIDSFVIYLNRSCFTGINSYEFHYSLFEEGAYYKKHIDQFKTDRGRAFSMIMYLNEGWAQEDGGELKVYKEQSIELITPNNKKCVFFKSDELPHEVLVTNKSRMSITGWLKTTN